METVWFNGYATSEGLSPSMVIKPSTYYHFTDEVAVVIDSETDIGRNICITGCDNRHSWFLWNIIVPTYGSFF